MLDKRTLEHRLISLEQAISDLQQKVESKPTPDNWLQSLIGSISDEAAFTEALEYGRAFRQADQPKEEGNEQS